MESDQRSHKQSRISSRLPRYTIFLSCPSAYLAIAKSQQTPVTWEPIDVTPILKDGRTAIPDAAIASIKKNKIALKGPLAVGRSLA